MKKSTSQLRRKTCSTSLAFLFFLNLTVLAPARVLAKDVGAVITQIVGALYVRDPGKPSYRRASKGEFVKEGTTLKTGRGDKAALAFVGGVEVKINEFTIFIVRKTPASQKGKGHFSLLKKGRVWFKKLKGKSKFQIRTPVAAVSVRGTEGDVKFGKFMWASCYEGAFNVIPIVAGDEDYDDDDDLQEEPDFDETTGVLIKSGQVVIVQPGKQPEVRTLEEKEEWYDGIQSTQRGEIRLSPAEREAQKDVPIRVNLRVNDAEGKLIRDFVGDVRLFADRDDPEFSSDGSAGWALGPLTLHVSRGEAVFYVRARKPGLVNLGATAEGFKSRPARFRVIRPPVRKLELEVEMDSGERKTIQMDFRR